METPWGNSLGNFLLDYLQLVFCLIKNWTLKLFMCKQLL